VWKILKHALQTATQTFVPQFLVKRESSSKWFTPTIKHHFNCVHSLRRKFKKKPKVEVRISRGQSPSLDGRSYESKLINTVVITTILSINTYLPSQKYQFTTADASRYQQ